MVRTAAEVTIEGQRDWTRTGWGSLALEERPKCCGW